MKYRLKYPKKAHYGWYVATEETIFDPEYNDYGCLYLHSDGEFRLSTKESFTQLYTGYFETKEEALAAKEKYEQN